MNGNESSDSKAKFEAFVTDLKALCIKHGVLLGTSSYGGLQVWRLDPGDDPLDGGEVDNRIK